MEHDVFLGHLLQASARCREFTTQFVVDALPAASAFWVMLNCSYDRSPLADGLVVFPDDVQKHGKLVGPLKSDAAVALLWRDQMVPQWIDISVWEADGDITYFELMCCGRFTAYSGTLYYRWTDIPPFGIKAPVQPVGVAMQMANGDPVEKFSLAESRQTVLLGRANRSSS